MKRQHLSFLARRSSRQAQTFGMRPLGLIAFLFLAKGCVSAPSPSIDDALGPRAATPSQPLSEHQTPAAPQQPSNQVTELLGHLRAIEIAYSRGLCDQVAVRAELLRKLLSGPLATSAPLSTYLAMSDCAARTAPENQEQNDRANQMLDTAMANLVPPLDKAHLLNQKAARLESRGKPDEAIKVRQLLAVELQKLERQEVSNNLALLRMNHRTARISATERDRVSALIERAMDDEVLFDTLRSIEAANASSMNTQSAPEMAAILRDLREQVVLRIEERFAIDTAALVKVLQSDKQTDADRMSSQLKILYPTIGYQRRIDATVAAFGDRNQSMPLAPDGQGPSIAYDTSDLTDDQRFAMASQAMASGRPDEAVRLLRSVPENSRSAELKRRLDEAESVHIRDLRLRVRDLLQRASSRPNPTDRAGDYREALEVLNFILAEYPKNSARKQIERNIRNIQFNLSQMNKKEQLP